jgi:cell division protein FtsQ
MSEAVIFPLKNKIKKKASFNQVLWILIVILIVLILFELIFHFVIYPSFVIRHIDLNIDGNSILTEAQIMAIAGLEDNDYYFSINTEEIERRIIEDFAWIKSVEVKKEFPDTLMINIVERKPLVISHALFEGKSVAVSFDEEGVVFQIGPAITEWNIPVISGFQFNPVPGIKLPDELQFFLDDLYILKEQHRALYDQISEIKIISINEVKYELVVFLVSYRVRLKIGEHISSKVIKYALMVLDVMEKEGLLDRVSELDLRTGEVVYKIEEE